ncbi:MAG: hypothetical protein RR461_06760 [Angelakisella sp.]
MDSMAERLEQLLNDDSTISQIQQIISSLRESGGPSQQTDAQGSGEGINPAMMNGLLAMLPTLTGTAKGAEGDPNVELLRALRPFLSKKRKKRVNEAVKLMKMKDMLPLLQQSGILSGFLGGDEDE